ncbi:MAG: DUF6044 family protein [Lachnospiraceae bacterium]
MTANNKKSTLYIISGLLIASLAMIPYLILGTGSIVTYHDQLDGELFSYLLTARYLFTDVKIYPELLNGLPANGAVPPAPLFVLFYKFFAPFTAFMMSQWFINLIGFLGMFLLLRKLVGTNLISFGISVIFMLMPFYPVYGLCIPGQPLWVYAVLQLYELERRHFSGTRLQKACYILLIILYGLSSSLVLVGFAWLMTLGIFALYLTLKSLQARKNQSITRNENMDKFHKSKIPATPWISFLVLLATYLLTNLSLIKQVLFPSTGYVSHKTEIVISPQNIFSSIKDCFLHGISYAMSYHGVILLLCIIALILLVLRKELKNQTIIPKLFGTILLICLFYGLYLGPQMTTLRNSAGGVLKEFNLGRIAWLLPLLWCVLGAYLIMYLYEIVSVPYKTSGSFSSSSSILTNDSSSKVQKKVYSPARIVLAHLLVYAILGIWGISVLLHSSLRPNLSKLVKGDTYYALDWDRFFAEDIFEQIDQSIGKPKDSYHVVSVGIYPAAAAYHGFYCLDGYSNNYPLQYKHTFREVMAGELEKSDYVRDFYDNWGNRCYITTAEQANYYTFEKKWNSVIYDLDLNVEKLKELDCQYIFSAAYIMNAEEMGLSLLQDAPFETENSWYHIYVYVVP